MGVLLTEHTSQLKVAKGAKHRCEIVKGFWSHVTSLQKPSFSGLRLFSVILGGHLPDIHQHNSQRNRNKRAPNCIHLIHLLSFDLIYCLIH